jgi:hypothetical protein
MPQKHANVSNYPIPLFATEHEDRRRQLNTVGCLSHAPFLTSPSRFLTDLQHSNCSKDDVMDFKVGESHNGIGTDSDLTRILACLDLICMQRGIGI